MISLFFTVSYCREKTPVGSYTPLPENDSESSDGEIPYSRFGASPLHDESTDDASEAEAAMAAFNENRTPPQSASSTTLPAVTSASRSAASADTSTTLTASPILGSPTAAERSPEHLSDVSK